jgi:hypothetical protein
MRLQRIALIIAIAVLLAGAWVNASHLNRIYNAPREASASKMRPMITVANHAGFGEYQLRLDTANVDAQIDGVSVQIHEPAARTCKRFLTLAQTLGATHVVDHAVLPLTGYRAQAQILCVPRLTTHLAGGGSSSDTEVTVRGSFIHEGSTQPFMMTLSDMTLQSICATCGALSLSISSAPNDATWTRPTWDQGLADASPGERVIRSLLDAVSGARRTHPTVNPNDPQLLSSAISSAELPRGSRAVVSTAAPSNTSDLEVVMQMTPTFCLTNGSPCTVCVSLEPYDSTYFGTPDPDFGYAPRAVVSFTEQRTFGSVVDEGCRSAERGAGQPKGVERDASNGVG